MRGGRNGRTAETKSNLHHNIETEMAGTRIKTGLLESEGPSLDEAFVIADRDK
jgi:sirohydrochlorin ferrochelatase